MGVGGGGKKLIHLCQQRFSANGGLYHRNLAVNTAHIRVHQTYPKDIPPLIKPATTPESASMSSVSDDGNDDLCVIKGPLPTVPTNIGGSVDMHKSDHAS